MLTGVPLTQDSPKHIQLAEQICVAIKQGHLRPNDPLPSARKLAQLYGINRHTVMTALQNLVAQGWLSSEQRRGYRVNQALPIESSQHIAKPSAQVRDIQADFALSLSAGELSDRENTAYEYSFAGGLADLMEFPYDEFRRHLSQACRAVNVAQLHYGNCSGEPALKQQLRHYLRRARALECDDLLVCNGSQEALFLIAKAFIRSGEGVAVESLGYPPAHRAFEACGATLHGIAQDKEGLNVDSLRACFEQNRIKLLYLTPLHQYPTMVTLSIGRRMAIYQLCAEYGVFIIEDDYDHEFHYRCPPLQPMAASDPHGIVIYVSTFSKIMFAGARMGYLVARADVLSELTSLKQLMNHKNDILLQMALANWMASGEFERHLRRMTKRYQVRCDALASELQRYQQSGYPLTFTVPDGGMAFWVNTHQDVSGLSARAAELGVYVQTEAEFWRFPQQHYTHIRLGFAGQNEQKMRIGLSRIISLL
ncbi:PLP-dependent aminotransferase family protein [Pseudoalteromonas ardens]|uniref:GntR family transcriptional regulator n=1 Tax=Pseudoalteromonas rubra TaxID=43658 RepID=A0A0L0ELR0_9GAMM|nr:PLP-dependent aminotransferase family protein [Pseudoalteromonas sp. R96]KNC65311.1 GntR family transcriptional regulator [Pseudoalteromonas rubra]MDK1309676.1 PLP-dependent aminotransferase family protein [Pseudoalteromonas sp. R96]